MGALLWAAAASVRNFTVAYCTQCDRRSVTMSTQCRILAIFLVNDCLMRKVALSRSPSFTMDRNLMLRGLGATEKESHSHNCHRTHNLSFTTGIVAAVITRPEINHSCPFGEPAQLRKKRARLFSSHLEPPGVESACPIQIALQRRLISVVSAKHG